MLSIEEQLQSHKLICPVTHQHLTARGGFLYSADGQHSYPVVNGVPVLLADAARQQEYLAQQRGAMAREYAGEDRLLFLKRFFQGLVDRLGGDFRHPAASAAFREVVEQQAADALCVSVGGGPNRVHPHLVNLNIGLFPNVDVVGDAYTLPYADGAVDAVYCEAVLEHLEYPNRAVGEMSRVLRRDGQLFAATPFLQPFHAYPDHYQNFTLIGHRRLFERAGFAIISAGVCVGPTFVLANMLSGYAKLLFGAKLGNLAAGAVWFVSIPFRPIDALLNKHPAAHTLASTTYVHAVKEG